MVAFVFLCFEEHVVELSEAENCCRTGRESLQSRSASPRSGYRGCDPTSCGLLKNPTLPRHGIHNRVNNPFQAGVVGSPFSWSVVGNRGKNSGSFLRERMWFWVCGQGGRQFPHPAISLGSGAKHVALHIMFLLIEKRFVQMPFLQQFQDKAFLGKLLLFLMGGAICSHVQGSLKSK